MLIIPEKPLEWLEHTRFPSVKARHCLLYTILEGTEAVCLADAEGEMLYAQTPGRRGWMWVNAGIQPDRWATLAGELVERLRGQELPGITGEQEWTADFARRFTAAEGLQYETLMAMEAYQCKEVTQHSRAGGEIRLAVDDDVMTIADYLEGFEQDAFGGTTDTAKQLPLARQMIGNGRLHVWTIDGQPVSMAQLGYVSGGMGRINAVYTPPHQRRKGYAGALVAKVCAKLLADGLMPVLFADLANPVSNSVYQGIGFEPCGTIVDLAFVPGV